MRKKIDQLKFTKINAIEHQNAAREKDTTLQQILIAECQQNMEHYHSLHQTQVNF